MAIGPDTIAEEATIRTYHQNTAFTNNPRNGIYFSPSGPISGDYDQDMENEQYDQFNSYLDGHFQAHVHNESVHCDSESEEDDDSSAYETYENLAIAYRCRRGHSVGR